MLDFLHIHLYSFHKLVCFTHFLILIINRGPWEVYLTNGPLSLEGHSSWIIESKHLYIFHRSWNKLPEMNNCKKGVLFNFYEEAAWPVKGCSVCLVKGDCGNRLRTTIMNEFRTMKRLPKSQSFKSTLRVRFQLPVTERGSKLYARQS